MKSRLGAIALVVSLDTFIFPVAGVLLARAGILTPVGGLFLAVAGALPAAGGALLGTLALKRHGYDRYSAMALIIGGIALVALAIGAVMVSGVPRINDITTDLADPVTLSGPDGNPIPYPSDFAEQQREGYPDLETVAFSADPASVSAAVREVASEMGWEAAEAADADRLQFIARTAMFRFTDDVAVRVQAADQGSVVDVRSRSRVGRSDLGANASRIRRFVERLQARID